jgi:hypothetical protein
MKEALPDTWFPIHGYEGCRTRTRPAEVSG